MIDKILRYATVDSILRAQPRASILEIGAGPHGLGCCLPYRFVGVDILYPSPPVDTQTAIKASAWNLPFHDRTFDVVLAIEVLEHIAPEMRAGIIPELCRVSRGIIFLSHPYGRLARLGDRLLWLLCGVTRWIGKDRPDWLLEHLRNPYPDPKDYLREIPAGYRAGFQKETCALVHPFVVALSTIDAVSNQIVRLYHRNPRRFMRWLRWTNFPPRGRLCVMLTPDVPG